MNFTNILTVILILLLLTSVIMAGMRWKKGSGPTASDIGIESIYDLTMSDIDGEEIKLEAFRGDVLLLVNVASKCGYTYQYEGLQELYRTYKDRGFKVLGFPANNFMRQEPGSNEDIKTFCSVEYEVSFPMFAKISVKGKDKHPLYVYLTDKQKHPETGGGITWNFNKFLVDRDGKVIARFGTKIEPLSDELITALEEIL